LFEEILDVAQRPRIKKYISDDVLKRFKRTFPNTTEYIVLKSKVKISPDPDDNYLLELSKDGKANFLISSDKPHILDLKKFGKTKIVSFHEFCQLHGIE
jgi:putative PIN family toxin of toxin-antitoxin system